MHRQTPFRTFGPALALAAIVAAAASLVGVVSASGTGGEHGPGGEAAHGHTPVDVCHWVPAHGGSYVFITVDDDGADGNANLQAHEGHENDIIPAPAEGCPSGADETPQPEATNTSVTGGGPTMTPHASRTAQHIPVTLCHWVPAHGGSYIVITVDDDGADGNANLQAHMGHENDIIPAPAGGCPVAATNTPQPTNTEQAATNTPQPTNTEQAATNTPQPTNTEQAATNTPGNGGGGQDDTPTRTRTPVPDDDEDNTRTPAPAATNTPTAGVGGVQTQPAGGVQGVTSGPRALPNAGTGADDRGMALDMALALGLVSVAVAGMAGVTAYRRSRR